jgi:hypothetical protein
MATRSNPDARIIGTVESISQSRLKTRNAQIKFGAEAISIKKRANVCFGVSGSGIDGAFGNGGAVGMGYANNVYSPHLSTDFLELPQNLTEKRSYYRHFYNFHPYVGRAIDLHTELPLSKIRLAPPKGSDPKKNRYILKFFQTMVKDLNLLKTLVDATREYYVIGDAFLFAEDSEVKYPDSIFYDVRSELDEEGQARQVKIPIQDEYVLETRKRAYFQKHYKGWQSLTLLPPEQVNVTHYQFANKVRYELLVDSKTRELVSQAEAGDEEALEYVATMPEDILKYIQEGRDLPLDTDPMEGSFVYQLSRNKPPYVPYGVSIIERCLRDLVYQDKLRQSQTSIASRAMTPKRLIYMEDGDEADVENLRDQIDQALMDPDYSIVTNFQVNWEEISARDRLLDLGTEYDIVDRRLQAGLSVTESMLTGESSYSGERTNLEIMNTLYSLYRETIQTYVEEFLFKPVAIKKGFVENDEFGEEVVLYPSLSFTRLALRDNRDTFDTMFNLYSKGSLSIDFILELFGLDPEMVHERVKRDLLTVKDPVFNDMMRTVYSDVGRLVVENTDAAQRIFAEMGLVHTPPVAGDDRF